jgi:hypothetical protein
LNKFLFFLFDWYLIMSPYVDLVLYVLYNYIDVHLYIIRTHGYGPSVVPPNCMSASMGKPVPAAQREEKLRGRI